MIDLWARYGARGEAAFIAEAESFAALSAAAPHAT